MSRINLPPLVCYGCGLLGIVVGAGITSATESMLPLAMGSALAVLCTAELVRAIRDRSAARRRV